MQKKNPLSLIGTIVLLLVFPAISWFYLKSGKDWRLNQLRTLEDMGPVPELSWADLNGAPLSRERFEGKMLIAGLLPSGDPATLETFGRRLGDLHEQFDDREDVLFPVYITNPPPEDSTLAGFAGRFGINDPDQVIFIPVPSDSIVFLVEKAWKFPLNGLDPGKSPFLALADSKGMIRRFFDIRNDREAGQLAEITAMILPAKKERELIFRRERER